MSFYPLLSIWLILFLLALSAGVAVYSYRRRNPAVEPWQHTLLLTLRMLSLALVAFLLLCPGRMTEERNAEKSHLVFLVDRSASMATRDMPGGQSRFERAAAFMRDAHFKRLADYPLDYYSFASLAARHSAPADFAGLTPENGTDFKAAVACVDKDIGLSRTAAIIFVTDGIDHSDFKGNEIAVPILSVQTGTDLAKVKDLGIEPFKCPEKISEGEELSLEVPLLLSGYATEQHVPFRVSIDGVPVHTATRVLSKGRIHTETVKTTLPKAGLHTLRIECDELPDEASSLNNRREIALEVVTAQEEVAAYFPVLNNSFRPLLREFTKNEECAFTAVYRVSGDTYRMMGHKMNSLFQSGLPKSADQLKNVTCLILGSHNGELLSPAEALVLEQYVNKGGSLICLAGADSFGKLPAGSPLLRLLPVVPLDDSFISGVFKAAPDADSHNPLADQVRAIIADNGTATDLTLTGLNQIKDIKANAKVELWAEGETRQPLLVWHTFGRGKVVALLSNALHQWGAPEKREANFGRFWRQLVAFSKSVDDDADLLKVTLPKTELASNESVTVTAIARHPAGNDQALVLKADVFPIDKDAPVATRSFNKKADSFMAELPGFPPGRYVLRVTSQDGQAIVRTRYKLLLVGDGLTENLSLRSDRELLRKFSSEKNIFAADEAEGLEDRLVDAVRKNIVQRESFLIFENPAFLTVLVLLLLAEWFLRRRFNLF